MKPVLFTIGKYNVYAFGFFLSLAFIFSTFIIWKLSKDEFKEEEYLDLFLYTSVVGLVTARLFYIIINFNEFGFNFLKYVVVRETPGLSLLPALLGGFLYLLMVVKKKKYNFLHIADIFSIAASCALVAAKIGEQLGGAAFGKITNFPLAIGIVGQLGSRHPTELYEAFVFAALSVYLYTLYKKTQGAIWPKGLVFSIFTLVTALSVFLLEFLKEYPVYLYGLSIRQISAAVITIAILPSFIKRLIVVRQLKSKKA